MKSRDEIRKEALAVTKEYRQCGVHVATGGGKTFIGLSHMNDLFQENGRFLVVAPKLSIRKEWIAEASKHGLEHLSGFMDFSTYLSLDKQSHNYTAIYLDECHSLKDSHDEWLSNYKGIILGLTGSPPRFKTSEKGRMVYKYCPIVYTYETDNAVDDKILNDYRIIVHKIPLGKTNTVKVTTKTKTWFNSEENIYNYWTKRIDEASSGKELSMMRVMRMRAMMEFPSKEILASKILHSNTDKILLFANTQDQADKFKILSCHSNNPKSEENLERFKSGNVKKLSCVHQLSEGINIPDLRIGIIMHAYGNERKLTQRLGRLLRLPPDQCSIIHVLCHADTVDEEWVRSALKDFDKSKITWVEE